MTINEIVNEVKKMTAGEIADVIMFEDMTIEEADRLMDAIPPELMSEVMSKVE